MLLFRILSLFIFSLIAAPAAHAASSSPNLAGYYDTFMALCDGNAYAWTGAERPRMIRESVRQVGVGRTNRYALATSGELLYFRDQSSEPKSLQKNVHSFYAGRSGLLMIKGDQSLWHIPASSFLGFGEKIEGIASKIADGVRTASVGDSANYFVTTSGELFVKGLAHRGQYGDGLLTETDRFVKTAENVSQIVAHTGHAILLKRDGGVWGTGGNIYGPVGKHGLGDKATRWSLITENAIAVATGASHSLAIKGDKSLWIWGRNETIEPKAIFDDVEAVAAGNDTNIALSGGYLWQWDTGSRPEKKMKCRTASVN